MKLRIPDILTAKKVTAGIFCMIMVAFLSFLLILNYRSQINLRKTALAHLVYEIEIQALNLGHYYSERLTDLETIAVSEEINTLSETRGSGMSMNNGLQDSLTRTGTLFDHFLSEKIVGKTPVYRKILLLGKQGEILLERSSLLEGSGDTSLSACRHLFPDGSAPGINAFRHDQTVRVMANVPYRFKGKSAGQVIACLNPGSFFNDPVFKLSQKRQQKQFLYFDTGKAPVIHPMPGQKLLNEFRAAPIRTPVRLPVNDPETNAADMIVVKVPVPDTRFFLIASQPVSEVVGYTHPSHLMAAMIILTVFVVAGAVALWRMNANALVLKTLLEQENIRKQEIEEKNIFLETEAMISQSLEKSLKESEEKFKTMSMAAQDAIIMVNDDGLISFWNRAATTIFGYSAHEAMEGDFCSILLPEKYDASHANIFKGFRKEENEKANGKTMELELKNRQGKHFPVELSLSTVKLEDKYQAICIIRDISERKNAEAEIENHRKNLEFLVKERTKALENAQIELVRKAVDAGRAQLSAMVLHNIGNAITPVSVNTERLRNNDYKKIIWFLKECYADLAAHKDDLSHYVAEDERGIQVAEYLGKLIEELEIKYAKTESVVESISAGVAYVAEILSLQNAYAPGRNELKEWINLNDLIKDALKIQESSLAKRKIMVEQKLDDRPLRLLIEKNKLMQVLVNFIKNSCDAMDENKSTSNHKLLVLSDRKGSDIVIKIVDTGCGIEAERLEEVFELGTSSKGTSGFGLYYCKTFIEENHGSIVLESKGKDNGASVTIRFETSEQIS